MEGSLYPDGTLVTQAHLKRTEETKADHILRNRTDITSCGIFTGGTITVNGVDPTRLDLAQLSGYVPNGEFIETSQAYTSIALDSYVAGVDNYVLAIYTEETYSRAPHETDGQVYDTMSRGAYRIRVYSEANYLALAETDENLANDSIDRSLILGIVNANGAAVALTASDITHPTAFSNILYATPNEPPTIPGVTITNVSSDSNTGTGSIDYSYAVGPVYSLTWTDPSTGVGAVVNPTVDGSYTLYGGGAVEHVIVDVVISQLPTSGAFPISENIVIQNLYEQDIPRFTAHDWLHRNYVGTGIVTENNPHGNSVEDFTDSTTSALDEHQDVQHNNGIWRGSSANIFWASVTIPPASDVFQMIAPAAGDLYYINGEKLDSISPLSFEFLPATIPSSAAGCHFYEIYADDNETSIVHLKASYPPGRVCSGTWMVDMSEDFPAGNYDFTVSGGGANPYGFTLGLNGASTSGTTVYVPTTDPAQTIRVYDETGVNWIDFWVNIPGAVSADANMPAVPPVTDVLVINASLDRDENMQIWSLTGWWNPAGAPARFQIGYPPYSAAAGDRNIVDKRPYGTTCEENMADSYQQKFIYHPIDELHFSGVLLRRNGEYNEFTYTNVGAPSLDIHISGGSYYCRGQRLTFDGDDITLGANKNYLLYVDTEESLQTANITDDFAGNLYDAMEYVLGSTKHVPGRDVTDPVSSDYTDHYYDMTDPPERGVLLYYVDTGAASIDTYCSIMRNVNGPVDPWSVAQHGDPVVAAGTNGSISSAFDNLYSAFAYAELALNEEPLLTAGIDMRIVGYVDVDREVTQPSNVRLWGTKASSTYAVEITHVAGSGAWIMSPECVIDGVYITNSAVDGTAIRMDDDCIVRNCEYHENVGANYDYFLCNAGGGAPAINRILIDNNYVSTKGGLFVDMDAAANTNVTVTNNTITQTGIGTGLGNTYMIRLRGDSHVIENNKITTFDAGADNTPIYGVYLTSCDKSRVSGNVITLEKRNGTISETGIFLSGCDICQVSNNQVYMSPTDNSDSATGVQFSNGSEGIEVRDNQFYGVSLGISGTGNMENISIVGNNIKCTTDYNSYYGVNLYANGATFKKIRIDENIIYNMYKNADASVATWSNALGGIAVGINAGAVTDSAFSICRNIVDGVDNDSNVAAAGNSYGISFAVSLGAGGVFKDLMICDNVLRNIDGDNNDASIGIALEAGGGFTSFYDAHIDRNEIYIVTDANPRTVYGIYNNNTPTLSLATFNNNNVFISYSAAKTDTGTGIYLLGLMVSSVVSQNSVEAPESGIFVNCQDTIISDNKVTSYGVGIFLQGGDRSKVSNNAILVSSYNSNIHSGIGGGAGVYGIVTENGISGFVINDNNIKLISDAGGVMLNTSGCIYVEDCEYFVLDGNYTKYDAVISISGGGRAYHIYLEFNGGVVVYNGVSVRNNTIYNDDTGVAVSILDGLVVYLPPGWTGTGTDELFAHISANTIFGSIKETGVAPVPIESTGIAGGWAAGPYELWISNIYTSGAAPPGPEANYVTLTGNAIHLIDASAGASSPRAYMTDVTQIGGGNPKGVDSNFTNWATNAGVVKDPAPAIIAVSNNWW